MQDFIKRNTAVISLLLLTILIIASIFYLCKTQQPLDEQNEEKIVLPNVKLTPTNKLSLQHISLLLNNFGHYNLNVYVHANGVDGLNKGVYYYNNLTLTKVSDKVLNKLTSPLSLIITFSEQKFDKDSIKDSLINAGRLEQKVAMQAVELNLTTETITNFNENDVLELNVQGYPLIIINLAKQD